MKTWLSWSSGKDSAWTAYQLQQDPTIELTGLVTTINQQRGRVAMHGTRETILDAQAQQLGVPVYKVSIPEPCDNATYEQAIHSLLQQAQSHSVEAMAFGDLFLEDVRTYRMKQLKDTDIKALFPLWQQPTDVLARMMMASGIKAVLSCVDTQQLPEAFVGRSFDEALLADLPSSVDPCGENGEFHTVVYDGPMFAMPLTVHLGEQHWAGQFCFVDVIRTV